MKKRFNALILLQLLGILIVFALSGCADISAADDSAEALSKPGTYDVRTESDQYVTCEKKIYSSEEQAIIDHYYDEMVLKYPEFGMIPREMLREYIYQYEHLTVSFTFCLGGIPTDCKCTYRTSPRCPEGEWEIEENVFKKFYHSGLTEKQMNDIRAQLYSQVKEYIDEYNLDKTGVSLENTGIFWGVSDGKPFAGTEYIADVTLFTTKKFGCGDHAHVFGSVILEGMIG